MEKEANKLPIGYWLKKVDALLTQRINETHAAAGLNRTNWQALHTLYTEKQISIEALTETLAAFAEKQELNTLIENLLHQDLIQYPDSSEKIITLTTAGQQLHQECLEKQQAIRQQLMQDVSKSEYQLVVETLKKFVSNLEVIE